MSLAPDATIATIRIAYATNCDYDLDGSTAKCRLFIQAARMLLMRTREELESGGERSADNYLKTQGELNKAEKWLAANDSSYRTGGRGCVRHVDFSEFRD
jgi:hypothetical protein